MAIKESEKENEDAVGTKQEKMTDDKREEEEKEEEEKGKEVECGEEGKGKEEEAKLAGGGAREEKKDEGKRELENEQGTRSGLPPKVKERSCEEISGSFLEGAPWIDSGTMRSKRSRRSTRSGRENSETQFVATTERGKEAKGGHLLSFRGAGVERNRDEGAGAFLGGEGGEGKGEGGERGGGSEAEASPAAWVDDVAMQRRGRGGGRNKHTLPSPDPS